MSRYPSLSMSPKFAPIGMKTLSSAVSAVTSRNLPLPRFLYSFVDGHEVAGYENIGESVVVVVEKPGGKAFTAPRHSGFGGYFCKCVVVIVVVEKVPTIQIRD